VGPEDFDAEVKRLEAIRDDEARMIAAHELLRTWDEFESRFSDIRHFAAKKLRERDRKTWTYEKIAKVLGLTGQTPRANAQRIVQGRRGLRAKRGGD
jgi:hypothetical protein